MESEARIAQAKEVLHHLLKLHGEPHSRIHEETAEENAARLRALEGICGHCAVLRLDFFHHDGKNRIAVRCRKGFSPVNIHSDVNIGRGHSCSGFGERNGKS